MIVLPEEFATCEMFRDFNFGYQRDHVEVGDVVKTEDGCNGAFRFVLVHDFLNFAEGGEDIVERKSRIKVEANVD